MPHAIISQRDSLDSLGLPWRCIGVGTFYHRLLTMAGLPLVLIVFVLAEVFREGARLRRESELTI